MENVILLRELEWMAAYWFCFIFYPGLLLKPLVKKKALDYRMLFYLAASNAYVLLASRCLALLGEESAVAAWISLFFLPLLLRLVFGFKKNKELSQCIASEISGLIRGETGERVFLVKTRQKIKKTLGHLLHGKKLQLLGLAGICFAGLWQGDFLQRQPELMGGEQLEGGLREIVRLICFAYPSGLSFEEAQMYAVSWLLLGFVVYFIFAKLSDGGWIPIFSLAAFLGMEYAIGRLWGISPERAELEYAFAILLLFFYFLYCAVWENEACDVLAMGLCVFVALSVQNGLGGCLAAGGILVLVLSIPKVFSRGAILKILAAGVTGAAGAFALTNGMSFRSQSDFLTNSGDGVERKIFVILFANAAAFGLSGWILQREESKSRFHLAMGMLCGVMMVMIPSNMVLSYCFILLFSYLWEVPYQLGRILVQESGKGKLKKDTDRKGKDV